MTITISDGRTYVARNGEKFGPMRRARKDEFNDEWPWTVDGSRAWKSNGAYSEVRPAHSLNLIAEWTEGPGRTATRTVTEIVPGNYGVVSVRSALPGKDGNANVYIPAQHLTPTELKAAAAVLLELAGALE